MRRAVPLLQHGTSGLHDLGHVVVVVAAAVLDTGGALLSVKVMGVEFVAPLANVPASATASCEDGSSSQCSLGVVVAAVAADWNWLGLGSGCWQQQQLQQY